MKPLNKKILSKLKKAMDKKTKSKTSNKTGSKPAEPLKYEPLEIDTDDIEEETDELESIEFSGLEDDEEIITEEGDEGTDDEETSSEETDEEDSNEEETDEEDSDEETIGEDEIILYKRKLDELIDTFNLKNADNPFKLNEYAPSEEYYKSFTVGFETDDTMIYFDSTRFANGEVVLPLNDIFTATMDEICEERGIKSIEWTEADGIRFGTIII